MNANPYLKNYNQDDIQKLYSSGSIIPDIDEYANLVVQNAVGQMYSSSITIPLVNMAFNPIKVETKYDVAFKQL